MSLDLALCFFHPDEHDIQDRGEDDFLNRIVVKIGKTVDTNCDEGINVSCFILQGGS